MTTHNDDHNQSEKSDGPTFWRGEPGRGKGVRIKTTHTCDLGGRPSLIGVAFQPNRAPVYCDLRPGVVSALAWAASLAGADKLSAEDRRRFANDYAAALEEIPSNQDPDRPLPTPADFADENWPDYWSWPFATTTTA